MASTSSHLLPPPPSFMRPSAYPKRNSDFFRSRLPNDPFSNSTFRQRNPIVVNSDRLYRATSSPHPTRDVILVLGDPSPKDLVPLLNSERLAFSLLIIASHQPPSIPSKVQPAIRILRLAEPLALEQTGALRFVNILEWAERVARTWRYVGGIGVRELTECDQEGFGALTPPSFRHWRSSSPSSPVSSTLHTSSSAPSSFFLDKFRLWEKREHRSERVLPAVDPSQRPFDALVNYLPSNIPEKSLLKHAILVTTVSRPFLVAASPTTRLQGPSRSPKSKRKSLYSMTPTPLGSEDSLNSIVTGSPFSQVPPIKAHLVHLLPPRPRNSVANRLLNSIETFLLSFSFPPTSEKNASGSIELARPCLLESTAFAEPVGTPPTLSMNWTIADILLSGCLDDEPIPRAWFSGASDIVVAALPLSQSSPATPPAARIHPRTSPSPSPDPSNPGSDMVLTPPGSENGISYRHAIPTKEYPVMLAWRWKFWKRPTTAQS